MNTFSSGDRVNLGGFVAASGEPLAVVAEFDTADHGLVLKVESEIDTEVCLDARVVANAPVLRLGAIGSVGWCRAGRAGLGLRLGLRWRWCHVHLRGMTRRLLINVPAT